MAKSLGSSNPRNVLKACVNGLKSQNSPKILSSIRGKQISEIISKRDKIMELNNLVKINKKKIRVGRGIGSGKEKLPREVIRSKIKVWSCY